MVTEVGRNLPLIHTENTDLRTGEQISPRINTDDGGSEPRNLPLIHTEHTDLKTGEQISPRINTDQDERVEKILPQSAEVYANRSPSAEIHANLG
jgi:hypothetical protein